MACLMWRFPMRLAVGTVRALALGWLATLLSSAVFPAGHPPMWYVVGAGVVLASFVMAPVGAGAALTALWQAQRLGTGRPPMLWVAFGLNLLLLGVAVGLWIWFASMAAR
jgi:hypothetical protein